MKPMSRAARKPVTHGPDAGAGADAPRSSQSADDSAIRRLSADELSRLSMDSWEPSLLKRLLHAECKLRSR